MDISTQIIADTAPLHLKGSDGLPLYSNGENGKPDPNKPVRVTVYSPGSDAYAMIETRQTQRALKRMDDNGDKRVAMTAEERLAQAAEDLADLTVGFENLTYGGKVGRELALAVYGDRKLGFIANQVHKFLNDWGNFKGAPAAP